ncbi:MAG TPA: dipeptidase [Streptosporangiaceae bacterium]|jgi:acetylornithine deacetylase/succinyl-diaminopimelate desuccinylase-like protein
MNDALRAKVRAMMPDAHDELAEFVAITSVADPRQFPPEECRKAAEWVAAKFTAAGLSGVALHPTPDGSAAVIGERPAPPGAPTVLLYCHYDVQPPLGEDQWTTPPFTLTERGGRWYGRGAADCKGNVLAHLLALRALGDDVRVGVKLVAEGSEEQGTGGLEAFVPQNTDLLRADAILMCDTGNAAVGLPTFTTSLRGNVNVVVSVDTLSSVVHSGMFGGPAPDALAALVRMLDTLRDADGDTTVTGLPDGQTWPGVDYPADRFRSDATVLDGVDLLGRGSVADTLWARPAVTILGIDCPPVVGSSAAIQPSVRARLNLRIPPGIGADDALAKLTAHLTAAAPWNARVAVEREQMGEPFRARTDGPAYATMTRAMKEAYGTAPVTEGQGGSIPLCNVFAQAYPDAEIILMGVEEPKCLIHAPNESVDPSEIEHQALTEALFLSSYTKAAG